MLKKMNRVFLRLILIILFLVIVSLTDVFTWRAGQSGVQAQGPIELQSLQTKAQSLGKVRVIVALDVQTQQVGTMSTQAVQAQQIQIASTQQTVVQELSGQNVTSITSFENIPFMLMEVDTAGLAALAALPNVTAISEDIQLSVSLTSSLPVIEVDDVWSAGFTGAGQTVAVIDSGVEKDHDAFGSRIVSEACYSTTSAIYNTTSVCPGGASSSTASGSGIDCVDAANGLGLSYAEGLCEHGTHVAGIMAGNDTGSIGAAKDADIISIQVASLVNSDNMTIFSGDILLALQRVLTLHNTGNYNIASANMSLGGGQYFSTCDNDNATILAIKAAIDNLRSVDIATVIASGNNGYIDSMSFPACISTGISVGATNNSDVIVDFSNIASFIDLLAPGYEITAAIPGNTTGAKSGTSMAAPHVAGIWALLKEAAPDATVDDILTVLKDTGTLIDDTTRADTPYLAGNPSGTIEDIPRINTKQALDALKVDIAVSKTVTPLAAAVGDTITYTLTFTNNGPNTASTVYLTDILPSEITGESYQVSGVSASTTGGDNYTWQIDNFTSSSSGTIVVTGQVDNSASLGSTINNSVTATTTFYDTDISNDTDSAAFTICSHNITVTNNNDSGSGSLRQAIADACDGATITFDDDYSIIVSSSLSIDKSLTIDGTGYAITISGNNSVRVIDIDSNGEATLSHLTIRDGQAADGGAIYNDGIVTVGSSTFIDNGAIGHGGGIYNNSNGIVTITNSTFSGNEAENSGSLYNRGTATVNNSTFYDSSTEGGNVHNRSGGTLHLSNSIIGNTPSGSDCINNGTLSTNVNNLVEDGTCSANLSGDPQLASLADYGGDTQTFALLLGSAAIDAGDAGSCESTDQRGNGRLTTCDIGAFESQGFYMNLTGGNNQSTVADTTFSTPLRVTLEATDTNVTVGAGYTVTFTAPSSGASLNNTSVYTGTDSGGQASVTVVANSTAGSYQVIATASGVQDSVTFNLTNDEPNQPPVLNSIGDQAIEEMSILTFTAIAIDPDVGDQVSYSLDGEPTGASIDSNGLFSWTPTEAQGPGSYSLDIVASDNGSPIETDRETITVTVTELNTAPVLDLIGNQTVTETSELSFTATASDADVPSQILSYSLDGEPTGASIDSNGLFSWTPTEAQGPASYTFDVVVSDDQNPAGTDRETITVTVDELNTNPILNAIGNQTTDEESELSFTASATDADTPSQTLSYSLDGEPAGASIDSNGFFSWTPTEAQGPASYTFDVVVSDDQNP
ncbi:MAG: S8 family serine peptidase, partial [Chloroflexota bacterium]